MSIYVGSIVHYKDGKFLNGSEEIFPINVRKHTKSISKSENLCSQIKNKYWMHIPRSEVRLGWN